MITDAFVKISGNCSEGLRIQCAGRERIAKMGQEKVRQIREAMNEVFVGKDEIVEKVLICLLAGGHVLLEDVPGVGKTTLASAIAKSLSCTFGRIQFTPDTLPSDVTGMSVYNMKTGDFEHKKGVIMNHVVLADEINRTMPKTQACLLEAMAEGQITIDDKTFLLPKPFMVIATQNPIEYLGTYPLPEAQMDRFMMRLTIGYPEKDQEIRMAKQFLRGIIPKNMQAVCKVEDILEIQKEVEQIEVSDIVLTFMQDIVALTRQEESFVLGVSPRALLALIRASQARAYMQGRDYVKPDDVKKIAQAVLLHRVVLTPEARIRQEKASAILDRIILRAKIPV